VDQAIRVPRCFPRSAVASPPRARRLTARPRCAAAPSIFSLRSRSFDLGQFERFRRVWHTPGYKTLLNHDSATIVGRFQVGRLGGRLGPRGRRGVPGYRALLSYDSATIVGRFQVGALGGGRRRGLGGGRCGRQAAPPLAWRAARGPPIACPPHAPSTQPQLAAPPPPPPPPQLGEGKAALRVLARHDAPLEEATYTITLVQRQGGPYDGYYFTESVICDGISWDNVITSW
jgi:hypothetical protein